MKANEFTGCSSTPVTNRDFEDLERTFGASLPTSFKDHYAKWNGGMPTLDWFPMQGDWEPVWIHEFLSFENSGSTSNTSSIQNSYMLATNRGILPPTLLPFAIDPGGNYFCLSLEEGSVSYHVKDVWDQSLSQQENQVKTKRSLTDSFEAFLDALVTEDEAYE